jgi:hypothetical protein
MFMGKNLHPKSSAENFKKMEYSCTTLEEFQKYSKVIINV